MRNCIRSYRMRRDHPSAPPVGATPLTFRATCGIAKCTPHLSTFQASLILLGNRLGGESTRLKLHELKNSGDELLEVIVCEKSSMVENAESLYIY